MKAEGLNMNWVEISIKTTHEGVDVMAQPLYEAGVEGVVIEDPREISAFIEENANWELVDESLLKNLDDEVTIKGYLPNDAEFHDKLQYIKERIKWLKEQDLGFDVGSGRLILTSMHEEDWANSWKKYFKPVKVGRRIVVKPSWEEYRPQEDEIVLELDPGMAFGTGTHQTTILCIQELERLVSPSCHVLDVGCGTGILAISSLLLGAGYAVAVDIDPNAVRIARKNAVQNGVAPRMEVLRGNLVDHVEGKYDLVVANIIADAIIALTGPVKGFLKESGVFIASGIILERLDDVLTALKREGYGQIEHRAMDDWAVVVARYA